MTAQSPITGYLTPEDVSRQRNAEILDRAIQTASRLTGVPVGLLRGKYRSSPDVRSARCLAWSLAQDKGMTHAEIARHSGHGLRTVTRGLALARASKSGRRRFEIQGIRIGALRSTLEKMSLEAQAALEARCAKTGETMSEALVSFWVEAHK